MQFINIIFMSRYNLTINVLLRNRITDLRLPHLFAQITVAKSSMYIIIIVSNMHFYTDAFFFIVAPGFRSYHLPVDFRRFLIIHNPVVRPSAINKVKQI